MNLVLALDISGSMGSPNQYEATEFVNLSSAPVIATSQPGGTNPLNGVFIQPTESYYATGDSPTPTTINGQYYGIGMYIYSENATNGAVDNKATNATATGNGATIGTSQLVSTTIDDNGIPDSIQATKFVGNNDWNTGIIQVSPDEVTAYNNYLAFCNAFVNEMTANPPTTEEAATAMVQTVQKTMQDKYNVNATVGGYITDTSLGGLNALLNLYKTCEADFRVEPQSWPNEAWESWDGWTKTDNRSPFMKHENPIANIFNAPNRLYNVINAANNLIDSFMQLNEQNQVSVVAYDSTAYVLLPMDHYTDCRLSAQKHHWQGSWPQWGSQVSVSAKGTKGSVDQTVTSWSNTDTDAALYASLDELLQQKDTVYKSTTGTVSRLPVVILLTDGAANTMPLSTEGDQTKTVNVAWGSNVSKMDNITKNTFQINQADGVTMNDNGLKDIAPVDYVAPVIPTAMTCKTAYAPEGGNNGIEAANVINTEAKNHINVNSGITQLTLVSTIMNTAAMKSAVGQYYTGNLKTALGTEPEKPVTPYIYTIGYDIQAYKSGVSGLPTALEAVINPSGLFNEEDAGKAAINDPLKPGWDAYSAWDNEESWTSLSSETLINNIKNEKANDSTYTVSASLVGASEPTYTGGDGDPITVSKQQVEDNIGYNKEFYTASSTGAGPSIDSIFNDVLTDIAGTAFSPIGGENAAGVSDALTFVDPIGTYMEVKNPYTSTTDTDADSDMNIALFGNLYGVVRSAVYDYQWAVAYEAAHPDLFPGGVESALPEGWYQGSGATATYAGKDVPLPEGIGSAQEAWASGWTYRINFKTIQEFVPNLAGTDYPNQLTDKQQNTVYTIYRIDTDQSGDTIDSNERNLWRMNPAYASSTNLPFDSSTYVLKNQDIDATDPPLGVYRLSDIRTWTEDTGDWNDMDLEHLVNSTGYDQALFCNIPSNVLPMQLVSIFEKYDAATQSPYTAYTTNLGGDNGNDPAYYAQSTPFRLLYSVGVADSVLGEDGGVDMARLDYDYLVTHKTPESTVYFDSNFYSGASYYEDSEQTVGDSVVTFSPGADNRFYAFQKNLQLYQIPSDGQYSLTNRPPEVQLTSPSQATSSSLTINDQTYPAVTQVGTVGDTATGTLASNGWYYIVIEYYQFGANGVATPVQRAIARQGSEFGSGLTEQGLPAGSYLAWVDTTNPDTPPVAYTASPGTPPDTSGKWAIATAVGGLRVGAMTMSAVNKGEGANVTQTASTVYAPLVSSTSQGAAAGGAVLNVDLGNNGRLEVADQLLLVTKQLDPVGFAPGQQFAMSATIDGFTGEKDAVVVNWDAESQNWVRRIATIDVLTNNDGLLQTPNGTLLQTDSSGQVVDATTGGQTYNVYVGENPAGGSHTFRIYQAEDDPNYTPTTGDEVEGGRTIYVNDVTQYQNTPNLHYLQASPEHPAGSMEFWADKVWLIPSGLTFSEVPNAETSWWLTEDGVPTTTSGTIYSIPATNNEAQDHQHFVFATRTVVDEQGMGSAIQLTSDVMLRSQYMTQSVTFDANNTATFSLTDGTGLVFDGIDANTPYTVSETLSQQNLDAQCNFESVRHRLNNGYITYGPGGQVLETNGSVSPTGTAFSQSGSTYTVSGDTGVAEEAVQFTNGPNTPPPTTGEPHKEELTPGNGQLVGVGEEITYRISYVNSTEDTATITIVDPLDAGVDYVKSSPEGTYNPTGSLPSGCAVDYVYQGTVTWTIPDVPAGGTGYVLLSVRVNEGAHAVDLVRDQAFVQVANGPWQPTEEPENPLGGPIKAEVAPGPGRLVKAGELITYDITYSNKGTQPATITIVDPLHVGVNFVSASDGGTYDPNGTAPGTMTVPYDYHGTVNWKIENVAPGTSGFVTLTVQLNDAGASMDTIYDQAFIEVDDGPWEPSDEPENPVEDGEPHKVEIFPGEKVPVEVGENVTYRIDYENPSDVSQTITIVDPIDVGSTFVFASDYGTYDPSGTLPDGCSVSYPWQGTVTWTIPDVPAGGTGYVILVVTVDSDAYSAGEIWDQAFVQLGSGPWQPTEMPMNPVVQTPGTPTYPSGTPSGPSSSLPKTGDDQPLILPMALTVLGVAALGLGAWLALRRRRT